MLRLASFRISRGSVAARRIGREGAVHERGHFLAALRVMHGNAHHAALEHARGVRHILHEVARAHVVRGRQILLVRHAVCAHVRDELVIEDVELVYWVDSSSFDGAAREDTAVPSWKFSTDHGDFYLSAYDE